MKFTRKINLILCTSLIALLSGCTLPGMSPIAQIDSAQHQFILPPPAENRQIVKERTALNYQCKNQQRVRIQPLNKKTINVTFGHTTYKLSSTVTKNHKRYSNIRWIWTEDFKGTGTLKNNRQKVLAEGCVRK
ncbi:hypothetical protein RO21_10390 [[Actinobacillus] muris]|uniref:Acetylglucosamine transferase n=1 Tax=Muribacter muris TaxID=67855 RepID=A0A0J5P4S5_9PAST|nr:MliC family protein [Muribacter muris]KMK50695.1 hypothetical protein RO21_10390 [[Actinobacillus] muris] [Muribacter muris]MBF0784848.1 MliC family protein [Muribacter muris]MBF0826931.1 MliC family protein [Muribacter muris]TFV11081.1 acetylglucosamine transferase [Muribacter muris]